MTGVYRFAELNIEIRSLHSAVHRYCRDYAVDCAPDLVVETTPEDIVFEREKSRREAEAEGIPYQNCSDDYLEELAVYRRIAEQMPFHDTILFHGSALSVDGSGYLFTAPSGTGKSTHARLWRELLGDRVVMINDDKPLIRVPEQGPPIVYGTPYAGKHRLSTPASVPLKAICLLEQAEQNQIHSAPVQELYPALLAQLYRPHERRAMIKALTLLDRMLNGTSLFRLSCNMELEAARIAYETMRRSETR